MENKEGKRKFSLLLAAIALAIVALIIGGFFYFWPWGEKSKTKIDEKSFQVKYFEAQGQETENSEEVTGASRLVFAERVVRGFSEQRENQYQTNYYLTDLEGEKKYNFYSVDDLTYEIAYPYIDDILLVLTEFGRQKNRLVSLTGQPVEDKFIPPVSFGPDFILSQDDNLVGYIEDTSEVSLSGELSFDIKYKIMVKNLADGSVIEFDPEEIKHQETEFTQMRPLGFSADNKTLYLFASVLGFENIYQNPSGLYSLDLTSREIKEIYFSSIDENEDKDLIVLLGLFPEQGIALVNRGPQINRDNQTIFRTQLQKLDLTNGKFEDLFVDENTDMAGEGGKILSPDGKKIILINDAYHDKGLSLLDLEENSKMKLIERGEFIAWASDSRTIVYQLYQALEEGGKITESLEIHTLETQSGEDYKIYTQVSLDEGTGLNKEGDVFYSFVGLL